MIVVAVKFKENSSKTLKKHTMKILKHDNSNVYFFIYKSLSALGKKFAKTAFKLKELSANFGE